MSVFTDYYKSRLNDPEDNAVQKPTSPAFDENAYFDQWEQDQQTNEDQQTAEAHQRSGEGITGFIGDVAAGTASGVMRGTEGLYRAGEWFVPHGISDTLDKFESTFGETAEWLKEKREDNPEIFGESKASQEARSTNWMNPRGWFYSGSESLGMLAPSIVSGTGVAGVATQFWGDTAQQFYDEATTNEAQGKGQKLSEGEKIMYANLRGFVEGGLEALQEWVPFKLAKVLPKSVKGNLVRSAIKREGNALTNVAKDMIKTITAESGMELTQEYLGDKIEYESGQSKLDPGWDDIKGVIGPTIVMSMLLGAGAQRGEAVQRKKLYDALTAEDVPSEIRTEAVKQVHDVVAEKDPELAKMFLQQAMESIDKGKPVALAVADDSVIRDRAKNPPQEGIDKLKESLEIENAQLRGEIGARNERSQADAEQSQADAEQAQAGQPTQEDHVVPEPNDEGVIGPDYEVPKTTVEDLDQRIDRLQTRIDNNPNDPNIERVRAGLEQVKTERAKLLEKSTSQEATQENAASTVQTPLTPEQAINELTKLGGVESLEGDTLYWKINTPEGPKSFKFSKPEDHAQILETVKGMQEQGQQENVDSEAAEASAGTESNATPKPVEQATAEQSTAEQSAAEPAIEPIELSKPVDSREFKRDQETGHLVFKDAKTGTTVRMRYEKTGKNKGWYHVDPQGKETFIGATRKIAVENINKSAKEIENTPKTKYSNIAEGDLIVDREAIPDDMEVETMVMTANTGQVAKTKFNAKKAIDSIESLQSKLKDILTCVGSD